MYLNLTKRMDGERSQCDVWSSKERKEMWKKYSSSKIKNNAIISREMLFDSKKKLLYEQELMASVKVLKDVVKDVKEKFINSIPLCLFLSYYFWVFMQFNIVWGDKKNVIVHCWTFYIMKKNNKKLVSLLCENKWK